MNGVSPYAVSRVFAQAALTAFSAGLLVSLPSLGSRFRGIRRSTWILLLAGVLASLFLLKPMVAHNVWYSNNHGIRVISDLRDNAAMPNLSETHGHVYYELMKCLGALSWGKLSVFSADFLVSTATGIVVFLLAWVLFESELAAGLSWFLLTVAPLPLRLSASEVHFVLARFFLATELLFLVLYLKDGGRRHLLLWLGSLFLLMQTRAEWLMLGPASAAFSILALQWGSSKRRPWDRQAVWCLAAAGALTLPWLAHLRSSADSRFTTALSLHALWPFPHPFDYARVPDAFFNSSYTPLIYPALLLAGIAAAAHGRGRPCVLLLADAVLIGWFYAGYHENRSTYTRVSLMTGFLYIAVAGCGLAEVFARLRKSRWGLAACAVGLASLFVVSYRPYTGLLKRLFPGQVEYLVLEKAYASIPPGSTVVCLTNEDAPDDMAAETHHLERDYLARFLSKTDGSRRVIGIRRFLEEAPGTRGSGPPARLFYYQAVPCHRQAPRRHAPHIPPPEDYLDPFCRLMNEKFDLRTVVEERVSPEPDDLGFQWEAAASAGRAIGLYEIRGPATSSTGPWSRPRRN